MRRLNLNEPVNVKAQLPWSNSFTFESFNHLMGNDGGSIPRRIELVKEKKKATIQNPDIERKAVWFFCALSKVSPPENGTQYRSCLMPNLPLPFSLFSTRF